MQRRLSNFNADEIAQVRGVVEKSKAKGGELPHNSGLTSHQVLAWLTTVLSEEPKNNEAPSKTHEVEEAVVRLTGRPSFVIKNGKAIVPENTIELWKKPFEERIANVNHIIPSVGRINLQNSTQYTWVGTAWLVSPGVVVTNRHVASVFAEKGLEGYQFKKDTTNGKTIKAFVDFICEYGVDATNSHEVSDVLYIAEPDEPDVAFLKVVGVEKYPVVQFSDTKIDADVNIVVIGFPAQDSKRNPAPAALKDIFAGIYDVKRAAPGKIIGAPNDQGIFTHDASTLGGNSGSLVLELVTGKALGLHKSGSFKKQANYAVSGAIIQTLLKRHVLQENPAFLIKPVRLEGPSGGTVTKPSGTDEDGVISFVNTFDEKLAPELKEQYEALEYLVGLGYRYLQMKKLDPRKAQSWHQVFDNLPFLAPGAFTNNTFDKTLAGAEISTELFTTIAGAAVTDGLFLSRFMTLLAGTGDRVKLSLESTKKTLDVMLLARVVEQVQITPGVSTSIAKLKLYATTCDLNSWVVETPCASANSTRIRFSYLQSIAVLNFAGYKKAKKQMEEKYQALELDKLKFFDGDFAS